MSETALDLPSEFAVTMDCDGCGGKGSVTRREVQIAKSAIKKHQAEHAYAIDDEKKLIGANCDCPRRSRIVTRKCLGCGGSGIRDRIFKVPEPGDRVMIIDFEALRQIFGSDNNVPSHNPVVAYVEEDKLHGFVGGVAVQVSWDRLNRRGAIPKTRDVDLWAFGIADIRIVK